ncbi:MAG: S8 family serine peptidase [Solirubrobacterales bacterium]|nr:S8 family serine peptidase [Solirubrobacterales bacterium]
MAESMRHQLLGRERRRLHEACFDAIRALAPDDYAALALHADGAGRYDEIVEEGIRDARSQGMLVVIAAGNDGRRAVSYPSAYAGATTVTAFGIEGTFPPGALEESEVLRPPDGADPADFLAACSNIGPQVRMTAPGVGILSTLPQDRFGPMTGTSMAAPAITGATACLLSRTPAVRTMPRDRARSDAIEQLVQSACVERRFGQVYEGYGLPDPATI